MTTEIEYRSDSLLRVLLGFVALSTLLCWLPTVRGFCDGPSYSWGLFGLSGQGLAGDYWFVLLGSGVGIALQILGWRGHWHAFRICLMIWLSALLVGSTIFAVSNPDAFRFRGDTLGVDIGLAWIAPVVCLAILALAFYWMRSRSGRWPQTIPAWQRRNWFWLTVVLVMLPVQFFLFRTGPPDNTLDKAGVILTATQWFLSGQVLRPYPRPDCSQ